MTASACASSVSGISSANGGVKGGVKGGVSGFKDRPRGKTNSNAEGVGDDEDEVTTNVEEMSRLTIKASSPGKGAMEVEEEEEEAMGGGGRLSSGNGTGLEGLNAADSETIIREVIAPSGAVQDMLNVEVNSGERDVQEEEEEVHQRTLAAASVSREGVGVGVGEQVVVVVEGGREVEEVELADGQAAKVDQSIDISHACMPAVRDCKSLGGTARSDRHDAATATASAAGQGGQGPSRHAEFAVTHRNVQSDTGVNSSKVVLICFIFNYTSIFYVESIYMDVNFYFYIL